MKWNKTDEDIENTRIYTADCILKALSNIYSSLFSTSLAKLEGLSFKCFTIFTKFRYSSTYYLQFAFIINVLWMIVLAILHFWWIKIMFEFIVHFYSYVIPYLSIIMELENKHRNFNIYKIKNKISSNKYSSRKCT